MTDPHPDPDASPGDDPRPDPPALPERLARIQDFLLVCDRLKSIERRSYLADGSRHETDAEHCWHLALYALLLKDELGFAVDLGRTLALIAVHDLVEIEAGDTYAYDEAGCAGQAAREAAAAAALFGRLPADLCARLQTWWREFEEGATPEARFARALDRLQAFGQSVASNGKAWRENGVDRARTLPRMREALAADPVIRALVEDLYARADRGRMWPER